MPLFFGDEVVLPLVLLFPPGMPDFADEFFCMGVPAGGWLGGDES